MYLYLGRILLEKLRLFLPSSNTKGYSLISILIALGLSTFILIGTSVYVVALFKLEYKNVSRLDRDLLLNEINELMKNSINCMGSIGNAKIVSSNQGFELMHLKEGNKNKFEKGSFFGKWMIKNLSLIGFKGDGTQDSISGFMGLNVTIAPTSANYYNSDFTQIIPLRVDLEKNQDPQDEYYRFTSCGQVAQQTSSFEYLCRSFSGNLINGHCLNTHFDNFKTFFAVIDEQIQAKHVHTGRNPIHVGCFTYVDKYSSRMEEEDSRCSDGDRAVITIGSEENDVDFKSDFPIGVAGTVNANSMKSSFPWAKTSFPRDLCITDSMTITDALDVADINGQDGDTNPKELQFTGGNTPPRATDRAHCSSDQYIQSIDPISWTATCVQEI